MGELVVISGRDPLRTAGGTESYAIGHALAVKLAGLEPHVFAAGGRTETYNSTFGVLHRVATPVRPARSITAGLQQPWLVPAVVDFLADKPGPHVLHGYASWGCVAVTASRRLAARGVQARPITTFFTTAEHEAAAKFAGCPGRGEVGLRSRLALELGWVRAVGAPLERRVYLDSHAAVVNYRSVRELLAQTYGERDDVHLLPYSPATAFDPPGGPTEPAGAGPPLIVSVARQDGRKGVDVLIHALAGLRDAGVPFRACLIGPGMLLDAHRRLVASLGLEAQVTLPGRVPDVLPYLRASQVFVLASTEEGSGSVALLEAIQAGTAIVATGVDGIPEDLSHELDALLVAPGSRDALRDALRRVLEDIALRRRLGTAARALYERRFAPGVVARALGAFYEALGLVPG